MGFISSDTYKLSGLRLYLMNKMNETAVTCHLARLWQKWDLNLQLLISRPVHSARGHKGLMGPRHRFFPLSLMFAVRSGNQRPVKNLSLMHVPFISIDFNTMDSKSI